MHGITLNDTDLAFVTEALAGMPGLEPTGLGARLASNAEMRAHVLGDQRLAQALLRPDDEIVPVSPHLLFEVFLRRAAADLASAGHTLERDGASRVPVFDAPDVAKIAAEPDVITYLSGMLASFTKVRSYTQRVWVRRGIMRKVRYSGLDVNSLLRSLREAEDAERPTLHRRIADLCLFILGMFPDFPATATRYPGSGRLRARGHRLSTEGYETLGARMYASASQDAAHAGDRALAGVLALLGERITEAKKPVSFMAEHYLGFKRQRLFGAI